MWWLKAFIHGLKTPLNGFDTTAGDKLSKVIPDRKSLREADAWLELDDHVRNMLVLESLRAKLRWRTSMVQMLEISERLIEKTANFGKVQTDACIWGAGGVNLKVKEFFRMVHPKWVRNEIKQAMALGMDETTSRCFTIALVELVTVFIAHVLWGGRTDEMDRVWDIWNVVDNTNTQAWMEKLWAGHLLASRYLRGMAVLGMRRKYNCATIGERTKFMHFVDPHSRVWEKGVYVNTAMDAFANVCSDEGVLDGIREVALTRELLDNQAFPRDSFAACSLKAQIQSMIETADGPKYKPVVWDSKCDQPLEHCLRELPSLAELQLASSQSAESPASSPAAAPRGNRQSLPADAEETALSVLESTPESVWVPPADGGEALVWSAAAAHNRNRATRLAWQKAVQTRFYSEAPPRTSHQTKATQSGFNQSELHPLLPQHHQWKVQPTFTAICYGVLGSAFGWIGEWFKPVAGSEIKPWCVAHASRLLLDMLQLGDLEKMTQDSMPASDVLIVGTTCTAVSVLGMIRGLADIKMKHMLMVAWLAIEMGYKVMICVMVPNILGYDGGAIQSAFENIFRAAG